MFFLTSPETLGLPASIGLVELLYVFATALHKILYDLALGGSLVITVQLILAKNKPAFTILNRHLISWYPLMLILAVSSYALPIVFLQGLHGRLFFSSIIEMGSSSLFIPAALAAAVTIALVSLGGGPFSPRRELARFVAIGIILLVHLAMTIHGDLIALPIAFLMRFAETVIVAITLAGIAIALMGYHPEVGEQGTVYGFRLVLAAAVLGACIQAANVWMGLTGIHTSPVIPVALTFAALLFIAVAGFALLGIMRPRNRTWGYASATATIIAIGWMSYTKLKEINFNAIHNLGMTDIAVRWQVGLTAVFFMILAMSLVALGLMLVSVKTLMAGLRESPPSIDF